jgi:uncharacterized protein YbjT (DUF2867 family)
VVLITGAAGKTGLAVIRALRKRDVSIKAYIHRIDQTKRVLDAGADEALVGEMKDPARFDEALFGVRSIYHICPNVSPDEFKIGQNVIQSARRNNISRFVYHSVFHPHVQSMPHHWLKMRVEEEIFQSRLNYTIVQPAPYMQNILANWPEIVEQDTYTIPYSADTRISLVDLDDVAQAAAIILTTDGHEGATYELCGPRAISQREIVQVIGIQLRKSIHLKQIGVDAWKKQAISKGLGVYQIDTLIKMFHYYDKFGYIGNPNVLSWLLDRPTVDLSSFIERVINS